MRRSWVVLIVLVLAAVPLGITQPAIARPGDLDTTFDDDGIVTTNFVSGDDGAFGVAIQEDGKIVVAGYAGRTFALTRYDTDGTLDTTFSGDGMVRTNFTPYVDTAYAVAIQADGKIVAAGWAPTRPLGSFALARYDTDGTLDTSFGGDGKVTTTRFGPYDEGGFAYGVTIQADGKIVAAGTAGYHRFALVRYRPNGRLDTTFSGDGKVTTNFTPTYDIAYGVAIQADGKIVAAGEARHRFALARYRTNGRLDTSFSGDGKVRTRFGCCEAIAYGVAIQDDGKIVAAGTAWVGGYEFALARYRTNGSLDTSFSGNGKVSTDSGGGYGDYAYGVAIQADGKIVAAGDAGSAFGLARFNTDGSLDTDFGIDGIVTTSIYGYDGAYGVAIQDDGKIVATGTAYADSYEFALARYLAA